MGELKGHRVVVVAENIVRSAQDYFAGEQFYSFSRERMLPGYEAALLGVVIIEIAKTVQCGRLQILA